MDAIDQPTNPPTHQQTNSLTNPQVIIGLTLLGAIFRFAELGSVRLTHDLAWQGWEAARIVNGVYPLLGQPSSVFLDNPPLMGYIQAIPLFFWRSPWSIFTFITLLNTLAIPFLYSAVEPVLGRRIAILSAVLFAINPWVVHFSRMTWTQGLLPFFLAVMFWGWLPTFAGQGRNIRPTAVRLPEDSSANVSPLPNPDHRIPFLLGWLALTAMCMTYVLAFAMLAPVGLLMLIFWGRLPKKELVLGITILLLAFGVYGWAVARNLDQNSGKFFGFLDGSSGVEPADDSGQILNLTDDAFKHAMRFVTGRDFVGQDINGLAPTGSIPVPIMLQVARWGLSAAFLAGLVYLLLKRNSMIWVLLVWFFVPIGLMMVLPSSVFVHPHYLLFTLPAGGIMAAVGLDWVMRQHRLAVWGVIVFLLAIGVQFKMTMWQSGQKSLQNSTARGLTALPLADAAAVGRMIQAEHADPALPKPIRMISAASDQMMSAMAGTWIDVVDGVQLGQFLLAQSDLRTMVVTVDDYQPESTDYLLALADYDYSYLRKSGRIKFFEIEPFAQAESLIETEVAQTSEAGLTLLGFSAQQTADQLLMTTYWRVDVLHDVRHEWFVSPFVHLINAEGATVANVAPHGQWGYRWQVGDVYASTVTLERPDDAVKLGIGLFDPISGRTFLLNGPNGNEARFEADLP